MYCYNLPDPIWGDSWPAGREGPDCWRGGQAVGTQGCWSWARQAEVRGHCHEDQGGEKADGAEDERGRTTGCQTGGAVRKEVWSHPELLLHLQLFYIYKIYQIFYSISPLINWQHPIWTTIDGNIVNVFFKSAGVNHEAISKIWCSRPKRLKLFIYSICSSVLKPKNNVPQEIIVIIVYIVWSSTVF